MRSKVESSLQDCLHRKPHTTYTQKIKLQGKQDPAMSMIFYMNCQLSYGMWTQHLKELEDFINHLANLHIITLNTTLKIIAYTKTLLLIKITVFQFALHRDPSRQGYTIP